MFGGRLPCLLGVRWQQVDEENQQQCQAANGTPTKTHKGHCQDLNEQRLWSKTKRIWVCLLSDLSGGSRVGNGITIGRESDREAGRNIDQCSPVGV
jgi:hypothetical protein